MRRRFTGATSFRPGTDGGTTVRAHCLTSVAAKVFRSFNPIHVPDNKAERPNALRRFRLMDADDVKKKITTVRAALCLVDVQLKSAY